MFLVVMDENIESQNCDSKILRTTVTSILEKHDQQIIPMFW